MDFPVKGGTSACCFHVLKIPARLRDDLDTPWVAWAAWGGACLWDGSGRTWENNYQMSDDFQVKTTSVMLFVCFQAGLWMIV